MCYSSSKSWAEPREEEIVGFSRGKERMDGWMDGGLLNHPGGLRNANFGCQVGTSRGVGRGKVREQEWHREEGRLKERRKEAREKGRDTFFAPLPLSFSTKSHPRLNFSALRRSRCENVASPLLRLDVSIQLFFSRP